MGHFTKTWIDPKVPCVCLSANRPCRAEGLQEQVFEIDLDDEVDSGQSVSCCSIFLSIVLSSLNRA